MKDIHCHILPGIDDGSESFTESIKIIQRAVKAGITDIIVTPHYIESTAYTANNAKKRLLLKQIKRYLKVMRIDINIYLGNEIFITENIIELIENDKIATMADTRYILVEFPLNNYRLDIPKILSMLLEKGYIPIIAHPERYRVYKQTPDRVIEVLEMGALLQGNYESLNGKYGKEAQKTLTHFLKKGWVTFLASDIHKNVPYNLNKTRKKLKKILKEDYLIDQFDQNVDKLLNNEEIEIQI